MTSIAMAEAKKKKGLKATGSGGGAKARRRIMDCEGFTYTTKQCRGLHAAPSRETDREADIAHWHLCRFVRRGARARYFDWGGRRQAESRRGFKEVRPRPPVILGTVPKPKYPKVKKVDALTWTMKAQESKKKRTGKLGANTPPTAKTKKSEGDKLGPRNLSH
jgi:hypothetical protein